MKWEGDGEEERDWEAVPCLAEAAGAEGVAPFPTTCSSQP